MAILSQKEILRLHAAVVSAHLTSSRATLLGGIDRGLRDRMPTAPSPSDQILSDLDELNARGQLADGSMPLRTWLENALALVGQRPEADIFRSALAALQEIASPSLQMNGSSAREEGATGTSGVEACAGAGRALPSPSASPEACLLIQTKLPGILARNAGEPAPILIREAIPTHACNGRTPLDQWTYVCEWLSRSGVPGLVFTLRIVEQVQSTSFSEEVSRWAAAFVEALLTDGGGGGNVMKHVQNLVGREADRWDELRRRVQVEDEDDDGPLSAEAVAYIVVSASVWSNVARLVTETAAEEVDDVTRLYAA